MWRTTVLSLSALLIAGCTTTRPVPQLELTTSLDRPAYRIGDPVIVTVRLKNCGGCGVGIPRFDHATLWFLYGPKGGDTRVHREPVHSAEVSTTPRYAPPGKSITRRFVFTRLTEKSGEHVFLASFRGAAVRRKIIPDRFYAVPVPFRVTEEIGLRRDPASGLILKQQAIDLAAAAAGGKVTKARAVLFPLGRSGLFTWLVMTRTKDSEGKEKNSVVCVDPYLGTIRPLEFRTAGAPKRKPEGNQKK